MKRKNIPSRTFQVTFNPDNRLTGMVQTFDWVTLARVFSSGRGKPIAGFEITPNGLEVHFNDIQTVGESLDYRKKLMNRS